ncbi:MAG: hypothetical protein HYR60_09765 [Acidobacteria bacterium]|nr:hypothetical protein [Acidobacteriota bacterium]
MKRSTVVLVALLLSTASFRASRAQEKKPPSDAEPKAIQKIEKAGGSVRKIAQNDDRQEVDFHLQGASVKDEDLAALPAVSNLVHLHLGKTSVTDAGLAQLKGLAKLAELHLEQTKVTDKGLAYLKGLAQLEYLNLYGTAVTDAGLEALKSLKNLRSLYVWQTKVTEAGANKLKQALPKLEIVRGWDTEVKEAPKEAAK